MCYLLASPAPLVGPKRIPHCQRPLPAKSSILLGRPNCCLCGVFNDSRCSGSVCPEKVWLLQAWATPSCSSRGRQSPPCNPSEQVWCFFHSGVLDSGYAVFLSCRLPKSTRQLSRLLLCSNWIFTVNSIPYLPIRAMDAVWRGTFFSTWQCCALKSRKARIGCSSWPNSGPAVPEMRRLQLRQLPSGAWASFRRWLDSPPTELEYLPFSSSDTELMMLDRGSSPSNNTNAGQPTHRRSKTVDNNKWVRIFDTMQ